MGDVRGLPENVSASPATPPGDLLGGGEEVTSDLFVVNPLICEFVNLGSWTSRRSRGLAGEDRSNEPDEPGDEVLDHLIELHATAVRCPDGLTWLLSAPV
ncbi:hypothetical protein LFM09_00990 [Lentzea alba]|uniref:hypothetical protein n=1 Tax=Lentzea alba TaxID=2714351 RepID=UPI0039BF23E2